MDRGAGCTVAATAGHPAPMRGLGGGAMPG